MQYQVHVEEQPIDISVFRAKVGAVNAVTNTEVWSEGGGGYVTQYGGVVQPSVVRSQTTQTKEIRVCYENGSHKTLRTHGRVTCVPGDEISVVFAGVEGRDTKLVGIASHTEQNWWSFDISAPVDYRRANITYASAIATVVAYFAMGGVTAFIVALGGIATFIAKRHAVDGRVNEAMQQEVAAQLQAPRPMELNASADLLEPA